MQNISKECCGCGACATICPKGCISMKVNRRGFLEPVIDKTHCIKCGACERVCPLLKHSSVSLNADTIEAYAAVSASHDDVTCSSSGGAFSVIARHVISKGGIVYGAVWTDDYASAFHKEVETIEQLKLLRGSKYIQSDTRDTYKKALLNLKSGRLVLFSGTPCQIKALLSYVGRKRKNLITVDVACYGAPSGKIWRAYWSWLKKKLSVEDVKGFSMTTTTDTPLFGTLTKTMVVDKLGGGNYMDSFYFTLYGRAFLSGLILNPACANCPAKNFTSGSDLTIGDFWNVGELECGLDVQNGVSVILAKTEQGKSLISELSSTENWEHFIPSPVEIAIKKNHGLYVSDDEKRLFFNAEFWEEIENADSHQAVMCCLRKHAPARSGEWKLKVKRILYDFGVLGKIQKIKKLIRK